MLLLTHKKGDVIFINDNIRIVVVDICEKKVKLGFDAPREIPIVRADAKKKTKE